MRAGKPEQVLPALARETGAEAVHFASDVSPFAMARDRRVEAVVTVAAAARATSSPTSARRARRTAGPFSVFSPFWRRWEELPRRDVHGAPRALSVPRGLDAGRDPRRAGARGRASRSRRARPPRASGCAAGSRDGIERYHERHDRLAGGTSELSPYLHFGCVSAREVEQRARAKGGAGAAAFVRQLAWRDFYAHVLLHQPGQRAARAQAALRRRSSGPTTPTALDAWRERPHRLPGRRRRDAPAAHARLDAQPRAADRRARS